MNAKIRSQTRMQELADLAGVSRATVSRAISGSPLVNAKTRERILDLARQHNYQLNTQARNLRLQRTGVVSVMFMRDIKSDQHMSDPFFLEMLGGIADCLAEHDLDLFLSNRPADDVPDLASTRLLQNSDGIIFIGQSDQHAALNLLADGNRPIVVWGAPVRDNRYCLVGGNNEQGGYLATSHLIETGRKKIAFFGDINLPEMALRHEGYLKALSEHGLAEDKHLLVDVPLEMDHARQSLSAWLNSGAVFDAAVCCSDVMAMSAINTLSEAGFRVPKDIAITGYDDIGLAQHSNPALTTINQNIHWAGRLLVDSLLELLSGRTVPDTMLASKLVIRQST